MISTRGPPGAASSSPFFVASGVSRIIILRRACEKLRKIREFEPTHVGSGVWQKLVVPPFNYRGFLINLPLRG